MFPIRYRLVCLGLWAVACAAGCGLGDYHKRMDLERQRIKVFDDEDKSLEGPLEEPTRKNKEMQDVEAWPCRVFLRPPKGYETKRLDKEQDKEKEKEKDKEVYSYAGGDLRLYRYPGPKDKKGFNLLIACGKVVQKTKDKVYAEGEFAIEDFRSKVRQAVKVFYQQDRGADLFFTAEALKSTPEDRVRDDGKSRHEVKYDAMVIAERPNVKEDPTHFLLYFHSNGSQQIALVYQVPKKDVADPDFQFKLDHSLKSLDISEQASAKKQGFAASRKSPKKS